MADDTERRSPQEPRPVVIVAGTPAQEAAVNGYPTGTVETVTLASSVLQCRWEL